MPSPSRDAIYQFILDNPDTTVPIMEDILDIEARSIHSLIKKLKESNLVQVSGSIRSKAGKKVFTYRAS